MAKKIFYHSFAGLANRLIAITCWMRIAEITGRELVISWPRSNCISTEWTDIFEPHLEVVDHTTVSVPTGARFQNSDSRLWTVDVESFDSDVQIIGGTYAYHVDDNLTPEHPKNRESIFKYFSRFRPSAAVRDRVEEVGGRRNFADTIGVHIRTGYRDLTTEAAAFNRWQPDDYRAIIDNLFHPRSRREVFVSSDSPEVRRQFGRHYNAFWQETRSLERGTDPVANIDALTDILLLSKCKSVVRSLHTTFSEFAAYAGARTLISIMPPRRDGSLVGELTTRLDVPTFQDGELGYQALYATTQRALHSAPIYLVRSGIPLEFRAIDFSTALGVSYDDPHSTDRLLHTGARARSGIAEYVVETEGGGEFAMTVSYAADHSRPCHIDINGETIRLDVLSLVTGGATEDFVRTDPLGTVRLAPGINRLRIAATRGALPYLQSVRLERIDG